MPGAPRRAVEHGLDFLVGALAEYQTAPDAADRDHEGVVGVADADGCGAATAA